MFTVWAASFAVFTAQAGVLAVEYETVSDALAAGLTERDPTADHYDASSAADLSMLGVGGVGLLLVLSGLAALIRLRRRSLGARTALTIVGALTVVAALLSWNVLVDARDVALHVFAWAPLLQTGLVIAGTTLLYSPPLSAWLHSRSPQDLRGIS